MLIAKKKLTHVLIEVVTVFCVMIVLFVLVPIRFVNKIADSLFGK